MSSRTAVSSSSSARSFEPLAQDVGDLALRPAVDEDDEAEAELLLVDLVQVRELGLDRGVSLGPCSRAERSERFLRRSADAPRAPRRARPPAPRRSRSSAASSGSGSSASRSTKRVRPSKSSASSSTLSCRGSSRTRRTRRGAGRACGRRRARPRARRAGRTATAGGRRSGRRPARAPGEVGDPAVGVGRPVGDLLVAAVELDANTLRGRPRSVSRTWVERLMRRILSPGGDARARSRPRRR